MTISERLADFVLGTKFEDIPEPVIRETTRCILDGTGVMLAGVTHRAGEIATSYVKRRGGSPEATVVRGGFKTSAESAAFANGVMAHALDFDDISWTYSGHPTAAMLPAVYAVAEKVGASGKDVVTSFAIGFEVQCKVGKSVIPIHYQKGFHSTGTIGIFGGVAAAGWLMRLGRDELVNAFGIAASESAGLRGNFGTMTKPFHVGRACENAIVAAALGAEGFTSSREAFEGPHGFIEVLVGEGDPSTFANDLGKDWALVTPGVYFKPYPSCGSTHPGIDAAISLASKHRIDFSQVESIECGTNPQGPDVLIYHSPKTGLEGKFSMEFCVVLGLLEKSARIEHFVDEKVRDPLVSELVSKTRMFVHPDFKDHYLTTGAVLEVKMKNGEVIKERVDVAKGHPDNPMTTEELLDKYLGCASLVLPENLAKQTSDMILNLVDIRDIKTLMECLI